MPIFKLMITKVLSKIIIDLTVVLYTATIIYCVSRSVHVTVCVSICVGVRGLYKIRRLLY